MALLLVADAFDVVAGAGVDFDNVALLDEARHDELATSLNFGGFRDVGGCIAFGPRFAFGHQQLDMIGRRHGNRDTIEQHHRAGHAVLQILPGVVDLLRGEFVLLEGNIVHEEKRIDLAVEKLRFDFLNVGRFEFVATLISSVQDGSAYQVPQLALVEGIPLAGFDEVHLDHQVRFAVDLDFQPFAEITGLVSTHFISSPYILTVCTGQRIRDRSWSGT
jgi:hypothetical protein